MPASKTSSAHPALNHSYTVDQGEVKQEIFAGKGNLYGYLFENNHDTDDCFVQVFNKLAADVTVGTTVPDYTYKIPAGAVFGKDSVDFPLDHFSIGCTIAVTSTRSGAVAPAADATIHIWYWNT